MMEDIAILTNGSVISEEIGSRLDSVTLDMLGTASVSKLLRKKPPSSMGQEPRVI